MELREYAEGLLYGASLQHKLERPGALTDERPGIAVEAPEQPGRSRRTAFEADRRARQSPNLKRLEQASSRAALLHHFANHELLAIELMALCLLRFPEAPPAFRQSLIASIEEEQRHFQLYQKQLRRLGVDFGDLPVNDFFWRHLRGMRSLQEFTAVMGLTFEQANLDYMSHYIAAFQKIGESEITAVLEVVLRDEIGHV